MEMTLPRCHADIHAMETLKLVNEMTSSNGATVMNAALEKVTMARLSYAVCTLPQLTCGHINFDLLYI